MYSGNVEDDSFNEHSFYSNSNSNIACVCNMNSYEYDTTMECRDNGVLCGVVRSGGIGRG